MLIKRVLETLEGQPEAIAALYKKGEDGKFHLEVDGDEPGDGYMSALQKERKAREAAEKALKEKEKAEADLKAAREREEAEKRGEYDKLRAQDQEALKKEREAREALESRLRNGAVERAALEAIGAAKGIPKALLPHILPALEAIPEGDGFAVRVKSDPGKKVSDFIVSLKDEMPWGFEGNNASGGGGNPGAGGGNTGVHARHQELSGKASLTNAESIELVRLAGQIANESKP